ncbi:MAG: 23S rRNA (pseudouridine(1915)-N(3))-methyltransferase RlmH [Gammaproteobacteria bacterium]|nr:23S rRNA (pseudouridine(1915)-N(3))-methyltransferase RlmH [Gammaproteobacteria bacterium]
MHLYLAAVGKRMPEWLAAGESEYLRRLPKALAPRVIEVEPAGGQRRDLAAVRAEEAARIRQAVPRQAKLVALDERGEQWSTAELAMRLEAWWQRGDDVALVIGGADGLDPDLTRDADVRWSLSRLTLPHQLVRVLLAEQLYRAWSLSRNHPYHRA